MSYTTGSLISTSLKKKDCLPIRDVVDFVYAETYDVIIIGGGAIGLATAYNLAKNKTKTLVLERFGFLNERGSSAGVSRQFRIPYPEPYMWKWR